MPIGVEGKGLSTPLGRQEVATRRRTRRGIVRRPILQLCQSGREGSSSLPTTICLGLRRARQVSRVGHRTARKVRASATLRATSGLVCYARRWGPTRMPMPRRARLTKTLTTSGATPLTSGQRQVPSN